MSEARSELRAVREAHRFDEPRLAGYLARQTGFGAGGVAVEQFAGGQSNPTFLLRDVATGDELVLRKKPPGKLLQSAHQVEREYRVMAALHGSAVPVARVVHLCEDPEVIGTPFYVMERARGRIFRRPLMPEVASNEERAAIMFAMNETLAALHGFDWKGAGLEGYGRPDRYMERQVKRWSEQYRASETERIEAMEKLMLWLPVNTPEDEPATIVHGDFRLENLVIHPDEPKVIAVLDWELSTLGHPLADLAYNCMLYHLPAGEFAGSGYLGADLDALGMPSEAEYVAAYARRTGRAEISHWNFFLAFSLFRLAAIVQGVYKRGLDGNASSAHTAMFHDIAVTLSEKGAELAGA